MLIDFILIVKSQAPHW